MHNEINYGRFFRHNRKLENCLIAIGLALFIALGMRGLDKINDRAVAAGEANRNVTISTDSIWGTQFSSSQLAGLASPVSRLDSESTDSEKADDDHDKNTKGKSARVEPHSSENVLPSNSSKNR